MKNLVIGILAHVDAGKTTLSESILYKSGKLKKPGRVDHKDAFLDTYQMEKDRGITIFSKQAVFDLKDTCVTLLDTPGHVGFSAEMERTLQVLDYGILVISGSDGVQGHTRTLWNLLDRYKIPVFVFVNKMDQATSDKEKVSGEMKRILSSNFVDFSDIGSESFYEAAAMCKDEALDEYLESGELKDETIKEMILERKLFPYFYGSALKMDGVDKFLAGLDQFTMEKQYPQEFGARVFKISRDEKGSRLTHLKITGGSLKVKAVLESAEESIEKWSDKADQIRVYSGKKFDAIQEAEAGQICAVTGLEHTFAGEGLGAESERIHPVLEPVLSYRVCFPEGTDRSRMFKDLKSLEEEDPALSVMYEEETQEIFVRLMEEIQKEVLKELVKARFDVDITFDSGSIVYKETISNVVEGVGHFEPLRHYAEVHLKLEPLPQGEGLVFATECSEDLLDKNWQRLIMTHLEERRHKGVLTGSEITDMKISLLAGRAHKKHTEGGDFRQSTYRAVRQGLMQAQSVLLEPYYDFRIELPQEMTGRAMTDIQKMDGTVMPPELDGDMCILTGSAPVSKMREYPVEVTRYSKGRGHIFCRMKGYAPCKDQDLVVEESGYDPETDLENPASSVFCAHGAGFYVPWDQVFDHMHIEGQLKKKTHKTPVMVKRVKMSEPEEAEKELEEIFIRTYGRIEKKAPTAARTISTGNGRTYKKQEPVREFLLVDGYNIIFAWKELKELAAINIDAARDKLMDILCNYQGFKKCTLILVFDAYRVEGCTMEVQKYHNIHVVYTKEAETADQYIEKVVHHIAGKYHVTVATSDGVEQVITLGQGGYRISAREFRDEIEVARQQIMEAAQEQRSSGKNYLFDSLDEELSAELEKVRLGRKNHKTV